MTMCRQHCRNVILAIGVMLIVFSTRQVQAVTLHSGDIVVASQSGGKLYKVDPVSGATTLLSSGGLLSDPMHVLLDQQGRVLTAERWASVGIVRTDPSTGIQTRIASGSLLSYPVALAFDGSNNLVVGNDKQGSQLVRVDMQTGTPTLLKKLANISSLQDVDVDSRGEVIVLDYGMYNSGQGKIIRYNPVTDQQFTVSSGGYLFNPGDLLISSSGDYIVANGLANRTTQILRIDPSTGAQQLVLTVSSTGWIASQDQNKLVFADFYDNLSVLQLDLDTGQTKTITSYHFPQNLVGVAVYSPVPEPSAFVLLGMGAVSLLAFARRRWSA